MNGLRVGTRVLERTRVKINFRGVMVGEFTVDSVHKKGRMRRRQPVVHQPIGLYVCFGVDRSIGASPHLRDPSDLPPAPPFSPAAAKNILRVTIDDPAMQVSRRASTRITMVHFIPHKSLRCWLLVSARAV